VEEVIVPSVRELYPNGYCFRVDPPESDLVLEGSHRPGFLPGVMTVVLNRHRWAITRFPCHTTVRTGPYTAVRRVELPTGSQSRKADGVEVSVGQRLAQSNALTQVPGTSVAAGGIGR
jgi:hypothetical protein